MARESLRQQIRDLQAALQVEREQHRITFAYVESRRVLLDRLDLKWKACLKAARLLRRRRAV